MKIALAQINFIVGDIDGNTEKIIAYAAKAERQGADIVIFSELAVTGYPPEDLVLRPAFQQAAARAQRKIITATKYSKAAIVFGGISVIGDKIYNTAFLAAKGSLLHKQYKYALPNYGVFDEKRIFSAGPLPTPLIFRNTKIGILICEDLWDDKSVAALQEAEVIFALNGSPFAVGKFAQRIAKARFAAKKLFYVNQVGGQDELVFDGRSFFYDDGLRVILPAFAEELEFIDTAKKYKRCALPPDEPAMIYQALVTGLRDYVDKNKFTKVILGLSGGIDSALCAVIAVDALGPQRVEAVLMPSEYTSKASIEDGLKIIRNLKISHRIIPIQESFLQMKNLLRPAFLGRKEDITEENMQARMRGMILMALSNKFGSLLLTTGNKSELATGYATLYGDMCGGFNPIKDIYKTQVYQLSRWRNKTAAPIPLRVIKRAPTAELRPDQLDQDTLPDYKVLDRILYQLVELALPPPAIIKAGYDKKTVLQVMNMLQRSEYKRRQAAPGTKISSRSFGRDWRYPITNRYK